MEYIYIYASFVFFFFFRISECYLILPLYAERGSKCALYDDAGHPGSLVWGKKFPPPPTPPSPPPTPTSPMVQTTIPPAFNSLEDSDGGYRGPFRNGSAVPPMPSATSALERRQARAR